MIMNSFAGFIRHVDANRDGKVAREELSSAVEKIRTADISAAPGIVILFVSPLLLSIYIYISLF